MMNTPTNYNEILIKAIKQKLSNKTELVNFLMDTLCITKQAAYRRLRGEVELTLDEAVLIAKKLGISIDQIVGADTENVSVHRMCLADFEDSSEIDYKILEQYVDQVRLAGDDPLSRMSISTNMFPQQMYLQYDGLSRFFLFLMAYHNRGKQAKAYREILLSERMRQIFRNSFEAHQLFKTINFVLDKHVVVSLIQKVRYFYNIELIAKEEVRLIHGDVLKMLAYLEKIAITGKNEKGSEVHLYISNVNFDKNYCNVKMQNYHVSIIETYILNGAAFTDKVNYDKMEEWILSTCRLSTMISSCGELQRIAFFSEQRKLLDDLLYECGL